MRPKQSHVLAAVEIRRRRVAELLHRGVTVPEIAVRLQEPLNRISDDAKILRAQWRADALGNVGDLMARVLAKLAADEESLRDRWSAERDVYRSVALFDRILAIQERRAKMLGFDVPQDAAISPQTLQDLVADLVRLMFETVDDADRRALLADKLRALREKYLPNATPILEATTCDPQSQPENETNAPPST